MSEERIVADQGKKRGACDFTLLIDATHSMRPCMDALKANVAGFIADLTNGQNGLSDWRGRVVAYRDVLYDRDNWLVDNPFVSQDPEALKAQLAAISTAGGGDEPESLLEALFHTMSNDGVAADKQFEAAPQSWRSNREAQRVIVVFTDATYHRTMSMKGAEGGGVTDIMHRITAGRFVVILYAPDHECYDELSQVDRAEWHPIPGPNFVQGLADYTSDAANFQKVLRALAASISASAAVPLA